MESRLITSDNISDDRPNQRRWIVSVKGDLNDMVGFWVMADNDSDDQLFTTTDNISNDRLCL